MQNVKLIRNLPYLEFMEMVHVYMTVETNMIIYCEWNTECERDILTLAVMP